MVAYQNCTLIYNPVAGRQRAQRHLPQRIADALIADGIPTRVVATTAPGSGRDLARRAINNGADLIVVAGGDGVINEVANGMIGSRAPLAILRAGTANVLATELGIGRDIERAAKLIRQRLPVRIAVGRLACDDPTAPRYFLSMAGVGFDAYIIYRLLRGLKAPLGKAAYWLSALVRLGRPVAEFKVTVERRERRAAFAIASRVRNYGGDLEIARGASILADDFELVLFEATNSFAFLRYLLGVITRRHLQMRGVTTLRAQRIDFAPLSDKHVHAQVDGEYVGRLPARVELIPAALTLLVPPQFANKASS